MNKVILMGNLTKKPEIVEVKEKKLAKFCIAVQKEFKTNSDADFFNVSAWENLAEISEKWLDKGSKVLVLGRLRNHTYENKDGVKIPAVEVVAEQIEFASAKKETVEEPKISSRLVEIDDNQLPF
jgi:single-strand DNA-binding protein